jgi:hypothetical protein
MEHQKSNPSESAMQAGHEIRDATPSPIAIFVIALVVTLVIVHFVASASLRLIWNARAADHATAFPTSPIAEKIPGVPPDPRLEPQPSHDVLPYVDLAIVRAQEQALIGDHAWAWVDSGHQFARIPIDEAMKVAEEKGLPTVLPATQPANGPFFPPASSLHGPGGVP